MKPHPKDVDDLVAIIMLTIRHKPRILVIWALLTLLLRWTERYPRTNAIIEHAVFAFKHEPLH